MSDLSNSDLGVGEAMAPATEVSEAAADGIETVGDTAAGAVDAAGNAVAAAAAPAMNVVGAAAGAVGSVTSAVGGLLDVFDMFGITTSSFIFLIDGRPIGSFQSLSGMEVQVEEYTFAEGGNNHSVIKRPGRMTWSNLVLTRGISMLDTLWDWINATSGMGFAAAETSNPALRAVGMGRHVGKNKFDAQTGALILTSPLGIPLRSWWVYEAMPVKWTGPDFSAAAITSGETVPMESLEIAHQGLKRIDLL